MKYGKRDPGAAPGRRCHFCAVQAQTIEKQGRHGCVAAYLSGISKIFS